MTTDAAPEPTPPNGVRPLARHRRERERRVLRVGLAVSLLVHMIVIAVVGNLLEPRHREDVPRPGPLVLEPPAGLRALELAVTAPAPATEPEAPEPDEPVPEAAPARVADVAERDPRVAARERRTAAERLAPRLIDPRLWRPMVLVPREPTFEDMERRVAAAIELLSDSALAEAERAVRARDWTVEDADGGRWGISPGLLHLGKVTLPLPIMFPVDHQAEQRHAEWYELDMQADRLRLLESFEARVKAIRERRDRERAERRPANGGGA